MIILDAGSGNTCKNDLDYVEKMIYELVKVDTGKHEICIKWQLFKDAPPNTPLDIRVFEFAYNYAETYGYQTTASVFDEKSLEYLMLYDVPFVKIANRPDLYHLAGVVAGFGVPALVSGRDMFCVSEYPATVEQYEKLGLYEGCKISDHTTDFTLYHKYKPSVYEIHYKLADSTGLDSGEFARQATQLKEIL